MLWKGATQGMNDVKGYDYYMSELDKLASSFANVINTINGTLDPNSGQGGALIGPDGVAWTAVKALDICISQEWIDGTHSINKSGDNATDTVKYMFEAMNTEFNGKPKNSDLNQKYPGLLTGINLEGNTFANYMNHISTVLANDSYANQISLKTNVTVLNGIQNSRDSISGVSLDEEASNMMMYMSAYNAASRLMTTLDQALDVLINNTGLVGR